MTTYKGKHRHREVAEFVVIAMSVWDRQHGDPSVSWDAYSEHDKNAAIARVATYEAGRPSPNNDRETMEYVLYDMLLPPKAKEEKKPVEPKKPEETKPELKIEPKTPPTPATPATPGKTVK